VPSPPYPSCLLASHAPALRPRPQQPPPFVWVLRVGHTDPPENVGKIFFEAGGDAADLAQIAAAQYGCAATSVAFFRVPRESALKARDTPSLAAGILVRANELDPDNVIEPGSWLLARVPPPAPPAAAGVTLEGLLGMAAPTPAQARVLGTIRTRFSARLNNALLERSAADAARLYEDALLVPSTFTLLDLQERHGLIFEDRRMSSDSTQPTKCWKGIVPYVLKSLTSDENQRAVAWAAAAAAGTPVAPPALVPFELLTHGEKVFMLMPWYLHTLSVMPSVSSDAALVLYRSIAAALDFLHGRGFAHCDVKASNICVDHRGAAPFVLVDLGSVARFGEAACSTEAYVPSDFDASGVAVSSPQLDWWMLAAALAEKAEGGLGFGGARRHERAAIVDCVQRRLPSVWEELGARLEDGRGGGRLF